MDNVQEELSSLQKIVEVWQNERSERIRKALDQLGVEWRKTVCLNLDSKVEFALLHHTLHLSKHYSLTQDTDNVLNALTIWKYPLDTLSTLIRTPLAHIIVVDSQYCVHHDDPNVENPIYTVSKDAPWKEPPLPPKFISNMVECICTTGLQNIVKTSLGVVVIMKHRDFDEGTISFCVSTLPGTIFIDYTNDTVQTGEWLIHESAHDWLNQCLTALNLKLPLKPTWFSPWKNTQRPAFGILHAVAAFSIGVQYTRYWAKISNISDRTRRYCQFRADSEAQKLKDIKESFSEALELIQNSRIEKILQYWYDKATKE